MQSDAATRLNANARLPPGMRRTAHGRPPTRAPIFGRLLEPSQARAKDARLPRGARRSATIKRADGPYRVPGRAWEILFRREELLGGQQIVALRARGFRSPARVPRPEQEVFHLELVGDCGEVVPRLDQRIAEERVLHQPEPERQYEVAAAAAGVPTVHNDDAAAWTQVLPRMAQDFEVVRHRVVAEAEHDAVKRLAGDVFEGVALGQLDVLPLLTPAERLRPAQHAAR